MSRHILIIDGHPDPASQRFGHALADAYAEGARAGSHDVRRIRVCDLEFPLLRASDDFRLGQAPPAIHNCQALLNWADHVVIIFPLWLGSMPALLKGFFEQMLRPDFTFGRNASGTMATRLGGKSARIVVTMGMPGVIYRLYFRAHSLKSLKRNVLKFCGLAPVRSSVVGSVEAISQARRGRWLENMRRLGRAAD
jgi:putative NADPH-quinone reductase